MGSMVNWEPMLAKDRLIVALDVPGATQALHLVASLGDSASTFKIGKQLFTAAGPPLVRELVTSGRKVFLDLKFHDIPNTVGSAVKSAAELGVSMLTVHAAVTVLTSLANADLEEIGVCGNILTQVLRLGALARTAGCGGLVASAQEAGELRRELGEGFAIVTPGVRPAGAAVGDQARVVTPTDAIAAGATHLVVGRPIIEAADPAKAAAEIIAEIEKAPSRR